MLTDANKRVNQFYSVATILHHTDCSECEGEGFVYQVAGVEDAYGELVPCPECNRSTGVFSR
jgi:ribosomal protein S27E